MTKIALFFAMVAFFLSGAWWEMERKAASLAALFGVLMLALALGGCK